MRWARAMVAAEDLEDLQALLDGYPDPLGIESERLAELRERLRHAVVVRRRGHANHIVSLGARVLVRDLRTKEERNFRIVFPWQADPGRGRISVLTPIGAALLGRRVGERLKIRVPSGTRRFEILAIRRAGRIDVCIPLAD